MGRLEGSMESMEAIMSRASLLTLLHSSPEKLYLPARAPHRVHHTPLHAQANKQPAEAPSAHRNPAPPLAWRQQGLPLARSP